MANIEKIADNVIVDAAQNMGWDPDENEDITPYLERMKTMTTQQIFDRYCNWNGLIEYGPILYGVVMNLEESK